MCGDIVALPQYPWPNKHQPGVGLRFGSRVLLTRLILWVIPSSGSALATYCARFPRDSYGEISQA